MTGFFSRMFDPPRKPGFFGGALALGSGSDQDAGADGSPSADDAANPPQWRRNFFSLDPNDLLFPLPAQSGGFGSLAPSNLAGGYAEPLPYRYGAQSRQMPGAACGSLVPARMDSTSLLLPLSSGAPEEATKSAAADRTTEAIGNDNQLALNWLEKPFVTQDMRDHAMDVMRGITGSAFSSDELNDILGQVIDNIERKDTDSFRSIRMNQGRVELTPEQYDIVSKQIEMLSPEFRNRARAAFQGARESGQMTCPQCPKGSPK